jgi:hypothetical protein
MEDTIEFEAPISKGNLKIRVTTLENGILILLTDGGSFRLGQSAIAIPPGHGRQEPTSTGFFTTGPDSTIVRTLAERVAGITNQTCMLVVGMKEITQAMMLEIMLTLKNHFVV